MPQRNPLQILPAANTTNNVSVSGSLFGAALPALAKAGTDALFGRSAQDELTFQEAEKAKRANEDQALGAAKLDALTHNTDYRTALDRQGMGQNKQGRLEASIMPEDYTMRDARVSNYATTHGTAPPTAGGQQIWAGIDGTGPVATPAAEPTGLPTAETIASLQQANTLSPDSLESVRGIRQQTSQPLPLDPAVQKEVMARAEVLNNRFAGGLQSLNAMAAGTFSPEVAAKSAFLYRQSSADYKKLSDQVTESLGISPIQDPLRDTQDLFSMNMYEALQDPHQKAIIEKLQGPEYVAKMMRVGPEAAARIQAKNYGPTTLTALGKMAAERFAGQSGPDLLKYHFQVEEAGLRDRQLKLNEALNPKQIAYTEAQTDAISEGTDFQRNARSAKLQALGLANQMTSEEIRKSQTLTPLQTDLLRQQLKLGYENGHIAVNAAKFDLYEKQVRLEMAKVQGEANLNVAGMGVDTKDYLASQNAFLNHAKAMRTQLQLANAAKAKLMPGEDSTALDDQIAELKAAAISSETQANSMNQDIRSAVNARSGRFNELITKWGGLSGAAEAMYQGRTDDASMMNRAWWMKKVGLIKENPNGSVTDNMPTDSRLLPLAHHMSLALQASGAALPSLQQFADLAVVPVKGQTEKQTLRQFCNNDMLEVQRMYTMIQQYGQYLGKGQ